MIDDYLFDTRFVLGFSADLMTYCNFYLWRYTVVVILSSVTLLISYQHEFIYLFIYFLKVF